MKSVLVARCLTLAAILNFNESLRDSQNDLHIVKEYYLIGCYSEKLTKEGSQTNSLLGSGRFVLLHCGKVFP